MNRWTVIVSGGMLEEEFARSVLENPEIEFIIGVDRGLEFLYRHEICPNYIVGDFDSVSGEILGYYEKEQKCRSASSIRSKMPQIQKSHCACVWIWEERTS